MYKKLWLLYSFLLLTLSIFAVNIRHIEISGNDTVSSTQLLSQLSIKAGWMFEPSKLQEEAKRLSDYYQKLGFLEAIVTIPKVIPINAEEVDISFSVIENNPNVIHKVQLNGNQYWTTDRLEELIGFSLLKEYSLNDLVNLQSSILDYYTSKGFLFASIYLDSLSMSSEGWKVTLQIDEGPYCRIRNYRFIGNTITKSTTLIKIAGLGQWDVPTPQILEQAAENLRKRSYLLQPRVVPMDASTLLIAVEEGRMTRLNGVLGYTNQKTTTQKNRFSGYLQCQFMNLWGTDRSLQLEWRSLPTEYQTLSFQYHESGPLRWPLSADFTVNREQQDSTYIQTGFTSSLHYQYLFQRFSWNIGWDDVVSGGRQVATITPSSIFRTGVEWNYSTLDYTLNPTKGSLTRVQYDWISQNVESLVKKKWAMEADWTVIIPLYNRWIAASALHGRYLSDEKAQVYELYNLGGFQSLRGYAERRFSGYRTAWINAEIRYRIDRNSRLLLFVDHGYTAYTSNNLQMTNDSIWSIGSGIRMQSKLGMVAIDYGLPIEGGRLTDWQKGMIHFGLETEL